MRRGGVARTLSPAIARETVRMGAALRTVGAPCCICQRRHGLGCCGGIGRLGDLSFDTLKQDPQFAGEWNKIQGLITSEGGTHLDQLAAQTTMADAFNTVATQFHYNGEQALKAASQLTTAGQTVAGAVAQVSKLISVAQGGDAGAIIQTFGGTLIAAAVAAGAVSAGVGGLVVAGISLVGMAVDSILNANKSPEWKVCGYEINFPPTIVVNCVASSGAPVAPNAFGWRHFPDKKKSADAWWYLPTGSGLANSGPITRWGGDTWVAPSYFAGTTAAAGQFGSSSSGGTFGSQASYTAATYYQDPTAIVDPRPIGAAWPDFSKLDSDATYPDPRLPDFQRGLLTAWKANAELQLNGCNSAKPADVLIHYLRMWNRAHDGSTYIDVGPGTYKAAHPAIPGARLPAANSNLATSWVATQIAAVQTTSSVDQPGDPPVSYLQPSGKLRIYTGTRKTPRKVIRLSLGHEAAAPAKPRKVIQLRLGTGHASSHPAATGATKPMGTAAKVATYGAAGAAGYSLVWLAMNGWKWVTPDWANVAINLFKSRR